jgi:hypothetical protein
MEDQRPSHQIFTGKQVTKLLVFLITSDHGYLHGAAKSQDLVAGIYISVHDSRS